MKKLHKKATSILLTAVMIFGLVTVLPQTASAAEYPIDVSTLGATS